MNLIYDFIDPINENTINHLANCLKVQKEPISHLTINVCSLGGTVSSGIAAYNYLKHMTFPITTHNLGEVSSAAILLYLAGTTRTSEDIAKFMIHPISIGMSGSLPYYQVQELLDNINTDIQNFSAIINRETESLKSLYNAESYLKSSSLVLNKQEAYECGIVTTP